MKNLSKYFLFIGFVAFLLADCKKDDTAPSAALLLDDTNFYFQALADNVAVNIRHHVSNYQSGAGGQIEVLDETKAMLMQSMVIMNPARRKNYICIVIQKRVPKDINGKFVAEKIIAPGKYPFAQPYDAIKRTGTDGVIIYYVDSQGKEWVSGTGGTNETERYFTITEQTTNSDGTSGSISTAAFSCMLYDEMGDSLLLTNGAIRCRSEQVFD